MSDIQGKVFVVTGATSGIGRAAVKELAARGAKVSFNGRRAEKGQALLAELEADGHEALFVQGDVTSAADLDNLLSSTKDKFGSIDVVFGNAGIEGTPAPLLDTTAEQIDRVFDINVKGAVLTVQHAVRALGEEGGMVVINSSVGSQLTMPMMSTYLASKAAVDAFVRVAAAELAQTKTRLYTINPVAFESEMADRASSAFGMNSVEDMAANFNPSGKPGTGRDVAEFLAELLTAPAYPNGSNIVIDHGPTTYPLLEFATNARAQQEAQAQQAAAAGES